MQQGERGILNNENIKKNPLKETVRVVGGKFKIDSVISVYTTGHAIYPVISYLGKPQKKISS